MYTTEHLRCIVLYIYMYMYLNTYMYMYLNTYMYMYQYIYVYIYMYINTYMYMYQYIYLIAKYLSMPKSLGPGPWGCEALHGREFLVDLGVR